MEKLKRDRLYSRQYRITHLEDRKAYLREYYLKNKEKYRQYYENNPEISLKANIKQLTKLGKVYDMSGVEFKTTLMVWSKTVKKLDNNMCKLCDGVECLHAHHIQPKKLFPELSLDIDNGITLCLKCHYETHHSINS